ncbi:hypothetical protein SHELI_v1c10090 [Spiroplasma helicoides]|uniref:Lipoprotein n=1 Tax=Spiroplasma helicoides TaxID=216938 RepID=A0A1B3SLY8_9MOLU|nr:lipoprotein [Spiroplasma helicoides]AOG60956.1 hypothetical protein SHELI_v1c10090 [Spiroplasma helicoides]
MKKLLSLLAVTGLVATSGSVAVACKKEPANNTSNNTDKNTEKKDLTKITEQDLKISPESNEETEAKAAVLAQIKTVLKIDVVENTDITFSDFTKATSAEKTGKIIVSAVESSKLVLGKVTFILNYFEPKDISELKGNDVVLQIQGNSIEIAKEAVINKIKSKFKVTVVENTDVTFSDFTAPEEGMTKNGKITVKSVSTSKVLVADKTATFGLLDVKKPEGKADLAKLSEQELQITNENSMDESKTKNYILGVINLKFKAYGVTYKLEDLKFGVFKAPSGSQDSSITVEPAKSNTTLTGTATFVLKGKAE